MAKQKERKPVLFNHFDVADTWRQKLSEDLDNCVSIAPKEWNFYRKAQSVASLKKYPPAPGPGAAQRRDAALEKFQSVISSLRGVSFSTILPDPSYLRITPRGERQSNPRVLARARSVCYQILDRFSTEEWFDQCRHGPGTSLGVPFEDTGNSRKFVPPWTSTESAVPWFEHYLRYDSLLCRVLRLSCPNLTSPGGIWQYVELVESSRLTSVPKNSEIDRTIAIEPTVNMFLQQGLGRYIAQKLRGFGVDIESQQVLHRKMAYLGSLTREIATIDFSSASDCVATALLQYLLPPVWFQVVDQIRCKSVTVKGEVVELPCIATMGNATTFVLETLVFFALAVASVMDPRQTKSSLPEWEDFSSVSVFGDDCILPIEHAPLFMSVCKSVGFRVNEEKSFFSADEAFRESCGADYLGGYNVRPIYLGGPRSCKPSNLRAWLYIMWNKTCERLITSLGSQTYAYTQTLQFVARMISAHNTEVFLVSENDPDDAGVKTFGDWGRLHRLFSIPTSRGMLDKNGTLRYRCLIACPPGPGLVSPEVEMWLRLKFPPKNDPMAPVRHSKDFTVRKKDRGYQVSWSSSFSDDLRMAFELPSS